MRSEIEDLANLLVVRSKALVQEAMRLAALMPCPRHGMTACVVSATHFQGLFAVHGVPSVVSETQLRRGQAIALDYDLSIIDGLLSESKPPAITLPAPAP